MPRVSVIVPAFNCAPYIGDAIRSIANQTERDLEILAVDDGSTDTTWVELEKLAADDSRVRIYAQPHSGRPAVPRNVGLQHATGEYIAFLDGDDLYHPRKIERQVAVLQQFPNAALVFSDMQCFRGIPDGPNTERYLAIYDFKRRAAVHLQEAGHNVWICRPEFYRFMLTDEIGVTTQTAMIRRSALGTESRWFREDLELGEDPELWLRIARRQRLVLIDEVLAYYRLRSDSVTTVTNGPVVAANGLVTVLTEHLAMNSGQASSAELARCRRKIARCLFDLGYLYIERGRVAEARAAYGRSLRVSPEARTVMALVKTLVPMTLRARWTRR